MRAKNSRSSLRSMSRLPFEVLLALRYLRPKRTFVSTITLISIIGVMLGVAVLMVVISVMTGFDRQLRDKILGFDAHLKVTMEDVPIREHEGPMSVIASNRYVKGVAPFVTGPVMVKTQPIQGSAKMVFPMIRGIDPKVERNVSALLSSIVDGTNDVRGNGILVGHEFALNLKVRVGDRLSLYSARDIEKWDEIVKKSRGKEELQEGLLPTEFEIRGIFDMGYYDFNAQFVICSLANAQDLYGLEDSVQGLMIMLHEPDKAQQVRDELGRLLGRSYLIKTWEEEHAYILDALIVEKNVMFYLLFFIMIVAAFGITSALITFVVQKTREIGILKALGASSRQIMAIFFSQSLLVGLLGVTAGFGFGMLAISYRNEFLLFLRRATGFELFPAKIYQFTELPALVDPGDITMICGGSLVICVLAGLFPAWNAGRLKPVEALRHE